MQSQGNQNDPTRKNSLKLGIRELNALLDRIESSEEEDKQNPAREFKRWNFRITHAELTVTHQTGSSVTIPVATRNISRGGISVLHSAFMYPKSRCHITAHLESGDVLSVDGSVSRCSHIGGKVHEIGIKFDEQISTKDLLGLDPMQEAYSLESIDPERLIGTVLVMTSSELDKALILNHLEPTGLDIIVATDSETAADRVQKGCDLILADSHLGSDSSVEGVMHLRSVGIDCPIIIMTTDTSNTTRDNMRMAGASGFLSKPIQRDKLHQALAEFLLADGSGGPIYTTLENTDPAFELLPKFLSELPRLTLTLEKSLKQQEVDACREICRTLAGTASPMGFNTISEIAINAERLLDGSGGIRDAAADLRQLIISCRRVKNRTNRAA